MLQRIQTIFLLLCLASFGLLFAFPFAASDIPGGQLMADRIFSITDHILLLILGAAGALIVLVSIFRFKDRPLQMRLNYLAIVVAILFGVVGAFLFLQEGEEWLEKAQISDKAGVYMPLAAILFAVLANRYIKKDHKTVRSAYDRLR